MATTIFTPSLLDIMPQNLLTDEKIKSAASALEEELKLLSDSIEEVMHLPRLEELPHPVLDMLAWQFHSDFYEPTRLNKHVKAKMIKESIAIHRLKGTRLAVENIARDAFKGATISEWYEYGGEPYFFRIMIAGLRQTSDDLGNFILLLNSVKNVRSWLDRIVIDVSRKTELDDGNFERDPLNIYLGLMPSKVGRVQILPEYSRPYELMGRCHAGVAICGAAWV